MVKIRKSTLPFPLPTPLSVTPRFPWTLQHLEISGLGQAVPSSHTSSQTSARRSLSPQPSTKYLTVPRFFNLFIFSAAEVLAL